MKSGLPRTLVQLHYHDRPGGVRRVMIDYADAFHELTNAQPNHNLLIWADRSSFCSHHATIVPLSECDYRCFASAETFVACRDKLYRRVCDQIERALDWGEVCVMGHNLTLGKNPALVSAFAMVARRFEGNRGVMFISVAHDLAEQGRVPLILALDRIDGWGIPIWDDVYCRASNVLFVAINPLVGRLLRRSGFECAVIPNPVKKPANLLRSTEERIALRAELTSLARHDGSSFDPESPTLLYPVRITARKNVPEAIILACLLLRANLLIGGPGASPSDRALDEKLRAICSKYRIPVLFGVDRIAWKKAAGMSAPFALLYPYVTACISTSIDEGFGYGLREPWLYGVPVMGRKPLSGGEFLMGTGLFYRRFPIRYSGLNQELRKRYKSALNPNGIESFERLLLSDSVDFGLLDVDQQIRILESCFAESGAGTICEHVQADVFCRHRNLIRNRESISPIIQSVAERVYRECSPEVFLRSFAGALSARSIRHEAFVDTRAIRRFFLSPQRFRLMLSR